MADVAPFLKTIFEAKKRDCSGFLKGVISELGTASFNLTDKELASLNADALIDRIASSSDQWIEIGKGAADGPSAADFASQGFLVVALLKAKDHQPKKGKDGLLHPYTHGHIAIVLPGSTNKDGYPYVICGSNNPDTTHEYGRSDGSRAVNEYVWRQVDAPNVKYYRFITKFPKLITK
jgi:hypothetical protein